MLNGEFPLAYLPGESRLDSRTRSGAVSIELSRRAWLFGVTGFATGAGGATLVREIDSGVVLTPSPEVDAMPARGTVEWALRLLAAPSGELVRAAGDLERISLRKRNDGRLVCCYQRVLDLALELQSPESDQAGACALRSLGRLGREDLLVAAATRIELRRDRPEMSVALETSLDKIRRRRRNR